MSWDVLWGPRGRAEHGEAFSGQQGTILAPNCTLQTGSAPWKFLSAVSQFEISLTAPHHVYQIIHVEALLTWCLAQLKNVLHAGRINLDMVKFFRRLCT